MIELHAISKRFGAVTALDDVSLELNPGERVAIVGENGAGKSSLMNVLYGLYQPDRGEVRFDGAAVRLKTPADALKRGVGMVHQHFTLVPTLTVAENVVLGNEPRRAGLLDFERAVREVDATCRRFGFTVDARARVDTLTVGSQQKVEIVKALHRGVKTLILDEPTAVLTPQEADELFLVTRRLAEGGLTVVLISHKLREVLTFATRVVVMRRGRKVAEVEATKTNAAALALLMVGDAALAPALTAAQPTPQGPASASPFRPSGVETGGASGEVVLRLDQLCAPKLREVSLEVRGGELVGIAGVDGNGQRELAEVITGLLPWTGGTLELLGARRAALTPGEARELGVAHIPEDRFRRAMVVDLTVEENVSLGRQRRAPFAKGPLVDRTGRRARTVALLEAHDVRPRAPALRMGALSGGNQQKLVVARELDARPRLLVVVQPTRGLDIAAVEAVRGHLREQRRDGCAVLLISLDLDEVLALADRVIVLYEGKITGEFARGQYDERAIGRCMLGVREESAGGGGA